MKRNSFPFVAICGMEKAKEAILLALVNRHAGGLLVSGPKGTGKSTLVRSARELVDESWVEVPISVTEDRLFGSIDSEDAIRSGKKRLFPGLIDEANGGIIYIDDVNLLRDDLLSAVLNVKEVGGYRLERDSLSEQRDTAYTLCAVMNPESGTLSTSLLDRFGLFVHEEPIENGTRIEIIKRVLAYEKDGIAFRRFWAEETLALKKKIAKAKALLPAVEVSDAMIQLAAVYTLKANVAGHRADIYLIEAARAEAALSGRTFVLPRDLEKAAEFVLPHRMRQSTEQEQPQPSEKSEDNPDDSQESKDNESDDQDRPEEETPKSSMLGAPEENESVDDREEPDESEEVDDLPDQEESDTMSDQPQGHSQENVESADLRVKMPPLWIEPSKSKQPKRGSGKRSLTRTSLTQGRYVRAEIAKGKTTDIAFDATLRAAAPYQRLRPANGCAVIIQKEDLRQKVREKRTGNIFLFLVDASGSMGARERMKTVKGVIFKILMEAYQKRDRVGMIAFRKNKAEVLLPVTRSVDFAQKKLANLPTGGKTPLAKGLSKAEDVLDMIYHQDMTQDPVVILITDGKATSPVNKGGDAVKDALMEARRIGQRGLPIAVIDTEAGYIKLGLAKEIAKAMNASYFHVDKLSEDRLLNVWRKTAGR